MGVGPTSPLDGVSKCTTAPSSCREPLRATVENARVTSAYRFDSGSLPPGHITLPELSKTAMSSVGTGEGWSGLRFDLVIDE